MRLLLLAALLAGAVPTPPPAAAAPAVAAAPPVAVAPSAGATAAAPAPDRLAEVERHLREHHARTRAPGFAYAVVHRDRVVAQATWGLDGNGEPVTGATPFVLGSVAKSFTALAVMQLVEAGQVELDAPAEAYLPWFRLADPAASARITVRHLLTHTSGIPDVAARGLTDRYDNSPDGLARSVRDLAAVEPAGEPGESHRYSDANYMIAGALVAAVSGRSFGAYLRTEVLDPLGMRGATTDAEADALGGLPAGHRYWFGRPWPFDTPFDTSGVPYGFLAASLEDMTRYTAAHLGHGEEPVLSAKGFAELHTGQATMGPRGAYGLGWRDSVLSGADTRIVWHAGGTPDSFSHLLLIPGEELAVVVLANAYGVAMDGPLTSAAFNAARILLGAAPVAEEEDPLLVWTRRGLLLVSGALLAALAWNVARAARRHPGRHALAATVAWVAGCAALAVAVGWGLPAAFEGARLRQVLLFAADIGHTIVAVIVLAAATAVARLAGAARTRRSPGPGR